MNQTVDGAVTRWNLQQSEAGPVYVSDDPAYDPALYVSMAAVTAAQEEPERSPNEQSQYKSPQFPGQERSKEERKSASDSYSEPSQDAGGSGADQSVGDLSAERPEQAQSVHQSEKNSEQRLSAREGEEKSEGAYSF